MRAERDRPGRVFPPLLTLEYGVLRADRAAAAVPIRLRVQHGVDMASAREQLEVGHRPAAENRRECGGSCDVKTNYMACRL